MFGKIEMKRLFSTIEKKTLLVVYYEQSFILIEIDEG